MAAYSAIVLFLIIAVLVALTSYYFGVEVTTRGKAQEFEIGQSRSDAYAKAETLLGNEEISAIQVDPNIDEDDRWWLIVNPEWWNDKITLTFEGDKLVEIRRDRICCELP